MTEIKFGTDGWRAVVEKDFNLENVKAVTHAIGKYISDNYEKKEILIGYDPRNMAYEFAFIASVMLKLAGFKVLLSKRIIPTPVLAYGARNKNTCAIMFTASHNPPEYLGMKFIPEYAGPATKEITDALTANLGNYLEKEQGGEIIKYDFFDEYSAHIGSLINLEKVKNLQTRIIYDGLYSASVGYFDKILDNYGIGYDALHMYQDFDFGGGMPEPKPKYLEELINKVKDTNSSIGLSNDGDGDRFGVINENGEYVTPNEILAILLLYLKENRQMQGPLVKTVAASLLLDDIARKTQTEVIETPVGFKYVGEAMRNNNSIIGGEESGGLSIQGHIPEKDGILADLLVLEAMAEKEKSLVELQDEVAQIAGAKYINERIDLTLESDEQVKSVLDKAEQVSYVAGFEVQRKDYKDGLKMYLSDGKSWILLRASGTEPLLRIYFETDSSEKMQTLKDEFLHFVN